MEAKNTIGKIYVRASPPNPLSLRRGGLKLPFSPQFFCLIGGRVCNSRQQQVLSIYL